MKEHYTYPAFFYFDDDGISIEFPDLPGCLPCAHSEEEAHRNAEEALGLHLYGMEKDGEPIPEPTPVDQLHPDEGGVVVMVDVFMPAVRETIELLSNPAMVKILMEEKKTPLSDCVPENDAAW